MDSVAMNILADKILEKAVLYHDQEAVVYTETREFGLEVRQEYVELRNEILDLIDEEINGELQYGL